MTRTRQPTTTSDWVDLIAPVDRRSRRRLRPLGREAIHMPGATILGEGDRADRFALILTGRVEIETRDAVIGVLGAGEFFGEVAMLYQRPKAPVGAPRSLRRTATVRAVEATLVREFDRAEMMTIMDTSPAMASRIARHAIGRLAAVDQPVFAQPVFAQPVVEVVEP